MDSDTLKLLAELLLEVKSLSAKVDSLQRQLAGVEKIEGWASPTDAATALKPDGVQSASHLKALRLRGAFSESRKEIRKKGKRWEYDVAKCRSALARHFKASQTS